ncbi:hypothetical protein [Pseudoalteromonas luteoviolacea]|uniref:Uncharacterized protein n=1 Tax=Pseudoalteromonas luteoviolacea S4060-1 TaxID=1365257 RepID=A0A162BAW5_9GAMM|nr:hypothetical protein [Pseudoalteromonas luteoviolacea]KZN69333.1 hypothetical protein N478_11915 [Pseudoalteromonas luteoviolacea S4060-1]
MRNTKRRPKRDNKTSEDYIYRVLAELQSHPNKLATLHDNCEFYQQQQFLKKGFQRAIEHMQWVLAVDKDVNRICTQIMADDYIGIRLRKYPLLFKGIIQNQD